MTPLRAVAVFEAVKGIVVLATALELFTLMHADAQQLADEVARHFVLNPASRYPRIIRDALAHPGDLDLALLSLCAILYATLRFAEAYGLWHGRGWAWKFGVLSAGIYIPFDLLGLARHVSVIAVAILAINVLIVLALLRGRHEAK